MGTTLQPRYKINGVIDTAKPVMQNIENIANSCVSWLTYDVSAGKWAVVINKATTSSFNFTDSNIIGGIKTFGTGLDRLYNAVEVQFPNRDLDDANDFVRLDLTAGNRKANEPDNLLKLNYPLINDPITAEQVGLLELNQSRVDLTIEFTADYSATTVTPGDVVSITNTAQGWTNKEFRVLQTAEKNTNEAIQIVISAIEYDASVYSGSFSRVTRSNADGVFTMGQIGQMSTPTVTKLETQALPRILIESTVPSSNAGIVEGVEVWYYDIPDTELSTSGTGNEWQSVDDEARTYKLHTVIKPSPGGTFAPNEDIKYYISDFTNKNTGFQGNFLIKLRAVNSTTQGPYSAISGLVNYVPKQTTDNITNNTEVDNGSGNILTSLGLSALMALLNGLLRDGTSTSGSMFDKIFDIFNTDQGFDPRNDELKKVANSGGGVMISAQTGNVTVSSLAQASSLTNMHTGSAFSPSADGTYKIDAVLDQNSSGAYGGRGSVYSESSDTVSIRTRLYNVTDGSYVSNKSSGGIGAWFWTDYVTTDSVTLSTSKAYRVEFEYVNDTATNPTATASFDIGWNVYSVS